MSVFGENVSVVIPARNEAATVAGVVESMRNHRSVDEVIVVDSASTDNTSAVASAEGARVIRLEQAGFGRAVKAGITAARNNWIFKLDADMTNVSPEWLSQAIEQLDDGVGLVKAYWVNPDDPLPMTNLALKPTIKLLIPALSHIRMPTSGIYFLNRVLLQVTHLADDFVFDLELLVRIYRLGYEIRQVNLGIVIDTLKPVSNYIETSSALLRYLHCQGKVENTSPLMVLMAHMQDVGTCCSGTVLKYLSAGSPVDIWITEDDENETRNAVRLFEMYSNASIKYLGCNKSSNRNTRTEMEELIADALIRTKPKTIITHHHLDHHRDHRICFDLIRTACLQLDASLAPNSVYMCSNILSATPIASRFRANVYIDISAEADLKYRILRLYGVNDDIEADAAKATDGLNGARCGARYAESYERVSLINGSSAQAYF